MTPERSWPNRFRVDIQTINRDIVSYFVVTWLSREKAVAIAVKAHLSRYGSSSGPMAIHDLEVTGAGPVERDADNMMLLDKADLTDRAEF
jgi:hypothetical protein